jgi:hypothetical protein
MLLFTHGYVEYMSLERSNFYTDYKEKTYYFIKYLQTFANLFDIL